MASAAASSSSSQRRYDVFLSFRGEDTRNNFTAHLLKELRTKGIDTFIDEERLETGQVISPALVAAIESSKFLSLFCQKTMHLLGGAWRSWGKFGEALAKHDVNLRNMDRVPIWRVALTEVANLSGRDSRNK
ncbi:Toll/interleukin-1 receptor-like protein [Vitis vinifera]|uniref:Toll/interleukin-1 receptor-like protein n=1 Tax=Vitis vinifera TaxID=29760 RepID=A0A438HP93_VITVI|nr:Toll/interleukin-1 receptor-like protein [Vitis vinifera]